jgi:hypothetical protein
MKELEFYKDKYCKIHVLVDSNHLYFTGYVVNVDDTHIVFLDKFKNMVTFRLTELVEITTINNKKQEVENE